MFFLENSSTKEPKYSDSAEERPKILLIYPKYYGLLTLPINWYAYTAFLYLFTTF